LVTRGEEVIALAPLYTDGGMIFLVGSAFESDYLGFIGDVRDPEILDLVLDSARQHISHFLGFRFYFVPDSAGLREPLAAAARRLGMDCYEEDNMPAPIIDLAGQGDVALEAASGKRVLKRERYFSRDASFEVHHVRDGNAILPQLEAFFQQHIQRWAGGDIPSRFVEPEARQLIERFTERAADTGWLRFTRINWQGRPIAFHYGYCYRKRFFWGIPSFDIELANRSPGQIMIRQLLLAAIEEGARVFDLGTGDQPFKVQLATEVNRVRTWGLYPLG